LGVLLEVGSVVHQSEDQVRLLLASALSEVVELWSATFEGLAYLFVFVVAAGDGGELRCLAIDLGACYGRGLQIYGEGLEAAGDRRDFDVAAVVGASGGRDALQVIDKDRSDGALGGTSPRVEFDIVDGPVRSIDDEEVPLDLAEMLLRLLQEVALAPALRGRSTSEIVTDSVHGPWALCIEGGSSESEETVIDANLGLLGRVEKEELVGVFPAGSLEPITEYPDEDRGLPVAGSSSKDRQFPWVEGHVELVEVGPSRWLSRREQGARLVEAGN
jgi:hypothetical protein